MGFDDTDRNAAIANTGMDFPAGCSEWGHAVPLHVDGELGEVERSSFESHIGDCPQCRDATRYVQAFRDSVRSRVPQVAAPAHLRAKLRLALDGEVAESKLPGSTVLATLRRWWYPAPFAAAGATALGIAAWAYIGVTPANDLVTDILKSHLRHPPMEFTSSDPNTIEQWLSDKVDFHVQIPRPALGMPLNLMGARLSHVRDHSAVIMVYGTPQSPPHQVSMVVYDDPGNRPPVQGASRRIDDHDVFMANRAGYNVAVWKQNEVVYSLVSDHEDDLMQLVHASNK